MAIKITLTNRILNEFRTFVSADTYEDRELFIEDVRKILEKFNLDELEEKQFTK